MEALLFDMDGVVVESQRHWDDHEAEHIFPETVAGDVDPDDVTGMNVEDLYDHLEDKYGTTVDEEEFLDVYDEHARQIYGEEAELLDSFGATVDRARERGAKVGLVSSSPVRWIELAFDRWDVADRFDAVVSADQVDHGKPDPDVYLAAAEELDVDPGDCVAVEDSAHGIDAANEAGMRTVGLRTPSNDADALSAADAVVDPDDLPDAIGSLEVAVGERSVGDPDSADTSESVDVSEPADGSVDRPVD